MIPLKFVLFDMNLYISIEINEILEMNQNFNSYWISTVRLKYLDVMSHVNVENRAPKRILAVDNEVLRHRCAILI